MKKAAIKEIDDIEQDVREQSKKLSKRVRRAVNPQRGFGC